MSVRKKLNSKVIALVSTIIIEAVFVILLTVNFGAMPSSKLNNADDETLMELEEMLAEDIDLSSLGKDPSTENQLNSSQTDAEATGVVKTDNSTVATEQIEPEPEPEIIEKKDTIPVEIPPVEKPEIAKKELIDSAVANIVAELNKVVKKNAANSKNSGKYTQKEKLEYYRKNYRLINNFKKVYPYALKTRELVENLNKKLATIDSDSEKRKLIKETEQMLFSQYEGAVRTMSISQGKLLLKLIARETNSTGYELIKQYRGAFSASFWYGVGKIFGQDLKSDYDQKNDTVIDDVLTKYKNDELY